MLNFTDPELAVTLGQLLGKHRLAHGLLSTLCKSVRQSTNEIIDISTELSTSFSICIFFFFTKHLMVKCIIGECILFQNA